MDDGRIELPDGQWWEIRTEVTYGMQRVFSQAQLTSVGLMAKDSGVDIDDAEGLKAAIMQNPHLMDIGSIEDAWLDAGSIKWSFKGKPTAAAALSMPNKYVKPVIDRMRILYAGLDEEQMGNLDETPPR